MNSLTIILGISLVALIALYYVLKSRKFKEKPLPESPDYPYIREQT